MKSVWTQIQARMRQILPEAEYSVWIATLKGELLQSGKTPCLVLYARNAYLASHLKKYSSLFQEVTASILDVENDTVEVKFDVINTNTKQIKNISAEQVAKSLETSPSLLATGSSQLLLPIRYNTEHSIAFKHSFSDFVVGPSNRLASAAAESILLPQAPTNMLFLSSHTGLGKTHLIQAIGMAMQEKMKNQPTRMAYLTAEQFTSQFVQASKYKDLSSFKDKFRGLDLLLLEDVHFLHGKEKTQEELLNIIKNMHSKGGRVVLTSSFAPKDIVGIDTYLASHFQSGFVASIERPDVETRFNILVKKSHQYGLELPENVAELMAKRIDADVRMLESCLQNVMLRAKVVGSKITEDIVYDVISHVSGANPKLDLASIVDMVCRGFGVTEKQLQSNSRSANYVLARNMVFYLLRKHTDMTLQEIGQGFNRRHSTVIKGISNLESEVSKESSVGRQLQDFIQKVEKNCSYINL